MKVLVIGATGYIGFNVALEFRREGFDVLGMVRDQAKGGLLQQHEIIPIVGNINQPESLKTAIADSSIIVYAAAQHGPERFMLDANFIDYIGNLPLISQQKKTFIYTSGLWVYGDQQGRRVNEETPYKPFPGLEQRIKIDEKVIEHSRFKGIVIRPAVVFGKKGLLTNKWFEQGHQQQSLQVVGNGENIWPMIHITDLAQVYVKAASANMSGEIFNIADDSTHQVNTLVKAVKKVTNNNKPISYQTIEEATKTLGGLAINLTMDLILDNTKAKKLLNWQPLQKDFLSHVDVYYTSWQGYFYSQENKTD